MKEFQQYTLGFLLHGEYVLLIEKQKPAFQKGFYNGLGGKVEEGEEIINCLIREIKEECNITTTNQDWTHICTMRCNENSKDELTKSWEVFTFIANINQEQYKQLQQKEEEKIRWVSLHQINTTSNLLLGNITWLIGMGIDLLKNQAFVPPIINYTGLSLPYKL